MNPFKKKKVDELRGFTYSNPSYSTVNKPVNNYQPTPVANQSATTRTATSSVFSPKTTAYPKSSTDMTSQTGSNTPSWLKTGATPAPVTNDYVSDYLSKTSAIAEKQKLQASERQKQDEAYYNKLYGQTNESLLSSIPTAQKAFDIYKTGQEQKIQKAKEMLPGEEQKVETQFGEEQKARAMTRRESEGRLRNLFAGLNATDSYGAGSYTQEISKLEDTFNTQTGQGLLNKLDKIFRLRQSVKDVENEANNMVATEELKLQETIRKINADVNTNNLQKQQLIAEVYRNSQDRVDEIDDYINGLQYENAKSQTSGLSDNFLKTGVPTTAAEFEFLQKNKDAFANLGKGNASDGKVLKMVDNLLGGNYQAVSGGFKTYNWMAPMVKGAGEAITDWEGLQSLLALAERGQLKGQGQISDFEAKMLEKAALAGLNSRLPEQEFKRRLELLRNDLAGGGTASQTIQVGPYTVSY